MYRFCTQSPSYMWKGAWALKVCGKSFDLHNMHLTHELCVQANLALNRKGHQLLFTSAQWRCQSLGHTSESFECLGDVCFIYWFKISWSHNMFCFWMQYQGEVQTSMALSNTDAHGGQTFLELAAVALCFHVPKTKVVLQVRWTSIFCCMLHTWCSEGYFIVLDQLWKVVPKSVRTVTLKQETSPYFVYDARIYPASTSEICYHGWITKKLCPDESQVSTHYILWDSSRGQIMLYMPIEFKPWLLTHVSMHGLLIKSAIQLLGHSSLVVFYRMRSRQLIAVDITYITLRFRSCIDARDSTVAVAITVSSSLTTGTTKTAMICNKAYAWSPWHARQIICSVITHPQNNDTYGTLRYRSDLGFARAVCRMLRPAVLPLAIGS